MNARLPIDNPAPEPKQPFSRQIYIGTLGGPIEKGRLWFFSSLEYVHEDASISYSPWSLDEFQALASLASAGFITGVNSIPVPNHLPCLSMISSGRCGSIGRSRRRRNGFCAGRWTLTRRRTIWCSRPRWNPRARLRTRIT